MSELRFTADHEWLRLDNDGLVTVGITHYAQDALGDVVYVQLPEAKSYAQGEEVAVLESVKAASNIAMPLDGEIVEVNADLKAARSWSTNHRRTRPGSSVCAWPTTPYWPICWTRPAMIVC